jgi:hypothetical protein
MTIQRTIDLARQHGVGGAYARVLSGAIRAAASAKAANAYRQAIRDDKAEHLFRGLETSCPTAA